MATRESKLNDFILVSNVLKLIFNMDWLGVDQCYYNSFYKI